MIMYLASFTAMNHFLHSVLTEDLVVTLALRPTSPMLPITFCTMFCTWLGSMMSEGRVNEPST